MSRILRVKVDICGHTDCACSVPWAICEEHMPWYEDDEFCARCGWERRAHPLPPPTKVRRFTVWSQRFVAIEDTGDRLVAVLAPAGAPEEEP